MIEACRQICRTKDKNVQLNSLGSWARSLFSVFIFVFVFALVGSSQVWSRPPTEADFLAANLTAHELELWLASLQTKPNTIAIFQIKAEHPLDPSFADVIEGEIAKRIQQSRTVALLNCFECRTPRLEVREDKLVIKKGIPDQAAMTKIGKSMGVDSFLFVQVFRTRFSLVSQVSLLQASDGTMIGSEQITVPSLDWSEAGLQLILAGGLSTMSGGRSDSVEGNHSSLHFSALEEIGFGKAGLIVGAGGGPRGTINYVTPAIGWRGRFGTSGIYSLKSLGVGYGISNSAAGLALRLEYSVFLGTFATAGVNLLAFNPVGNERLSENRPITSAITLFVGFSLGR